MAYTTSDLKTKKDRKLVQCPVCKVFRSGDLNRHMRVHAAAHIPCDHAIWGCALMFRQKSNMRMHVNAVHYKRFSYPCPHWWVDVDGVRFPCRHKYKDASSLHRHRRTKHGYVSGDGHEKNEIPTRMGTRFSQIRAQRKPSARKTEWTDVDNAHEYEGGEPSNNAMDPFYSSTPSAAVDDAAVDDIVRSLSSSASSSTCSSSPYASTSNSTMGLYLDFKQGAEAYDHFPVGSQDFSAMMAQPQSPVAKIENEHWDGNGFLLQLYDESQSPVDPYGTLQLGDTTTDMSQFPAQIPQHAVQMVPQPWTYTLPGVVPVLDDPAAYGAPALPGVYSVNMAPIPDASILAAHHAALCEQELVRMRMWMGMGMGMGMDGVCAGAFTPSPPSSRGSPVTEPSVQGWSPCGGYAGGAFDGVAVPPPDNSFDEYYHYSR